MYKIKYRTITSLFFIIILYTCSQAQVWKQKRQSFVFSLGLSHFMGDLGGGAKDAAHLFGIRDLNIVAARPVLSVKYRYKINEWWAAKFGVSWAILSADDKNSKAAGRKSRNLHFKSNLLSVSVHGEYFIWQESVDTRYSFSYKHGLHNLSAYFFAGLSFNLFNPKAKLDGQWYELQPLGTEGQGIDDNAVPYQKYAIGLPLGIGVSYFVNRKISVGIELSNTFTNSDYIDDVHGDYFDNEKIKSTYGEVAARLADRHLDYEGNPHTVPKPSGHKMRGNPKHNDSFIFTVITITYNLKKDRRGLPKFH